MAETSKTANLEALGFEQFTPYAFERQDAWILLPILSLLLVIWHLKDLRPRLTGTKLRLNTKENDSK